MILKDFLSLSNPEEYDFKKESPWKDVIREVDPLTRFIKYKSHKERFDCDSSDGSCSLTNEIYDKLCGWHFTTANKRCISSLDEMFGKIMWGCDTMNSFWTTYNKAEAIYTYAKEKDITLIYSDVDDNPYIQEFAYLTHSIGNFTLIPHLVRFREDKGQGYFQSRGIKCYYQDYWDRSLQLLKKEINFGEKTFSKYISTFYHDEYVNANNEIIPLFEGHFDRPLPGPQTEEELNKYLENVICRIRSRGKTMVAILMKHNP
ncbi:MAG: hypothetical protein K0S04_3263 [Herbinix sp.]|jgi:hypothetical protein|nr:hypothetical protein [Herbinix sp.]